MCVITAEQTPVDGRWTCPNCSRFISVSAITAWDEPDPGAYYGVTTRYTVDCASCGHLTDSDVPFPNWVVTRWAPLDNPQPPDDLAQTGPGFDDIAAALREGWEA